MADGPAFPPKKTLEELKNKALAKLERRGYEVRGKTPAEIRQLLRRRRQSPKSIADKPSEVNRVAMWHCVAASVMITFFSHSWQATGTCYVLVFLLN